MSIELEKAYEPQQIEDRIYEFWMDEGVFEAEVNPDKESYCIVIPPPNVTGVLHIGHALDCTIQDLLIRWKRMSGFEALWIPGTDHAGIATQNVMERELQEEEGITRHDLGREAFVERVWELKERHHGHIVEQLKRFGSSLDWSRERFTMDEGLSRAVREAFVQLWEEGLLYRGDYMVNWCPRCSTGLSDLEVENIETEGKLWHIHYPRPDGEAGIVVATTRPETMLGDTAVAVHPDDERYQDIIGDTVILPLMEREIPIIADDSLDMEFGTGALKVTPAHDPADMEIGNRHNLDELQVIDRDARMTAEAKQYEGLDRYEARKQVVADLQQQGLLEGIEDYEHRVPHCSRCDTVVEPLVSTQWFVAMEPLAENGLEAVERGDVQFVPQRWTKVYRDWLENIRDWPISRQLWWGHPIPVWYCDDCGEVTCTRDDPTECVHCGSENLQQDEDVLDTWFSSQLWPFSTLGWPDETPDLEYFYPTSTLVTAYDIIYFWVARMIMAGLEFTGEKPFDDVFIHGLVRDGQGRKISKSLGNNIDPIELVDEYGADALRFALTQLITHGQDLSLVEDRFVGARNFGNKLWNASRFVLMNLEEADEEPQTDEELMTLADRWIISRHNRTLANVDRMLDSYDLADAANELYDHVWGEFCDWYVELAKVNLYSEDVARRAHTQAILRDLLDSILRALHPFMPYITEEVWQRWRPEDGPIAVAEYPTSDADTIDADAEEKMALVQNVMNAIRSLRGDFNITRGTKLAVTLIVGEPEQGDLLQKHNRWFEAIADVAQLKIDMGPDEKPQDAVSTVADGVEVFLHIGDAIEIEQELRRIGNEIEDVKKDVQRSRGKLANSDFVEKAPEDIVERERRILSENEEALKKLREQQQALAELNS